MLVQVLTAGLSGGWSEMPDGRFRQDQIAHFFAALKIDLFGELEKFKQGMDEMMAALHRAPPAPGHPQVYVPGEIEHQVKEERTRNGIPLTDKEVDELRELSEQYGVPVELTR